VCNVGKEAKFGFVNFFFLFPVQLFDDAVLFPTVLTDNPVDSKNTEQSYDYEIEDICPGT
jgi:hypothetical protein